MIKSRKITIIETEYYDICKKCGREVKGSRESQVKYNLDIHIKSCKGKKK